MCGILKFKPTINNSYTIINLHGSLQDLGLYIQCLATHYFKFQTGQPLTVLVAAEFPRSFFYYSGFSPIMLALCFASSIMSEIIPA